MLNNKIIIRRTATATVMLIINIIRIGNGSEENHVAIFMTSLAMCHHASSSLMGEFHVDCTYRLNRNGFPTIVFGRTDSHQVFHPLFIGIMSHETEAYFENAFRGFKELMKFLSKRIIVY